MWCQAGHELSSRVLEKLKRQSKKGFDAHRRESKKAGVGQIPMSPNKVYIEGHWAKGWDI